MTPLTLDTFSLLAFCQAKCVYLFVYTDIPVIFISILCTWYSRSFPAPSWSYCRQDDKRVHIKDTRLSYRYVRRIRAVKLYWKGDHPDYGKPQLFWKTAHGQNLVWAWGAFPSKHDTLSQCRCNVAPPSSTVDQRCTDIGSAYRAQWAVNVSLTMTTASEFCIR